MSEGSKAAAAEAAIMGDADAAAGNVDKIREIIFGGQMRDYDRRFSKLEQRLLNESEHLHRDLDKRIDDLEPLVRKELHKLGDHVQKERGERMEADKRLRKELQELDEKTAQRASELDEKLNTEAREIRDQLRNQDKALRDAMREMRDELSKALASETDRLSADKVSRGALADLMTEVAMRLNQEFDLPGNG